MGRRPWHGVCSGGVTMLPRRVFASVLVAACLCSAAPARANEGPDEFVAEVVARNPSLRARALRRSAFQEEARASDKWPDPYASVMVDRVPQAMGGEMPMIRYQVSQMVPWPGKLGLMREAVEHQGEGASAEIDVRRLDLRFEARRGWLMLLLNGRQREVNRASRNLAATIAAAALGRYSAGMTGHHDVARAQVEVSALDDEIVAPTALTSPHADYVMAPLIERAIRQRPELRGMRAMKDEALAMARLARREPYPDLMGSVWMNQNIGGSASAGVMVGATIPVFGISRQQHRASAFDDRAHGSAQDEAAMRAMIRFEVADALIKVQTATRQLDLIETVALPKARESFEASLAGYGASTVDLVGVLDARRALQNAELARAEAQVTREVAVAALERATGGPPGEVSR